MPAATENVVLVGHKPLMNYVHAIVKQFVDHDSPEVVVKARGKAINRAVDAVEIVRKRLMKDQVELGQIQIDTEHLKNEAGEPTNVSTLEITMIRRS